MSVEDGARVIGDYIVGRQLGSGSYSVVWHGRHRTRGTEVAIKEIALQRLSSKLRDSIMSEVVILKRVDHPNIIRLYDIIQTPGKLHIVLEYCRGGDLSVYIKKHGAVEEWKAKYIMQQLAAGLQILRQNDLIHRDLKPQNLLLSSRDGRPVLKIADFGFARSLQPRDLAETLCGSPLYMAPEILQLQKYDAKADLWSVGAILYQLVTGKPPFTADSQLQLLRNIKNFKQLQFPSRNIDLSCDCIDLCKKLLRPNPVERLTFEEFFRHSFVSPVALNDSSRLKTESCNGRSVAGDFMKRTDESSRGVCSPIVCGDHRATDLKSSPSGSSTPNQGTNSFTVTPIFLTQKGEKTNVLHNCTKSSEVNHRSINTSVDSKELKLSKDSGMDSLELIVRDYVIVSMPSMEEMASTVNASCHAVLKSGDSPRTPVIDSKLIAPAPKIEPARKACEFEGSGNICSAPSSVLLDSTDPKLNQSSSHFMSRIHSLLQCAYIVRDLVAEKNESGKKLQAFAVQLVLLAIWKQALHMCHSEAASAVESASIDTASAVESASIEINSSGGTARASERKKLLGHHGSNQESQKFSVVCSRIEQEFLFEIGQAEEFASGLQLSDGNAKMPDALETIFQSALKLGKLGAAVERAGKKDTAVVFYAKAVQLLSFLLVEAPLILNPPLSLSEADEVRLRSYIDILNKRQNCSSPQRSMTFLNEDQPNLSR